MNIAIDAMGGDYAPLINIKGAIQATKTHPHLQLTLVGDEILLKKVIEEEKLQLPSTIKICHAEEVVGMEESPAAAVRKKKKSSIAIAADLVKTGRASALISAGNTGAIVSTTILKWRLLNGIHRAGIALC